MSRAPTSPRRSRKQRDRTVGRRRASWSAQSRIVTPAGGSSSVLSRADWASSFIRSALSMIATRAPPSTGMSSSSPTRSLTPAVLRVRATDDDLATGPGRARGGGGPGGCRARPAGTPGRRGTAARRAAAVHSSPAAMSSARVVLPTPSGPTRRTAWGTAPRIIVAAAASAAACPRVRAPFHEPVGQTGSAGAVVLRVVRRFGAASAAVAGRGLPRLASPSRPPACGSHAAWPEPSPRALAAPSAEPARPARPTPADSRAERRGCGGRGLGRTRLGRCLGRGRRAACAAARGLAGALAGLRRSRPAAAVGRHADVSVAGRERGRAGRPADRRLLGDLGSKQRLELGRHVAPRLVRAATGRRRRRPVARRGCSCGRRAVASPDGSGRSRRGSG